jgi:hypothetical protein
MVILVGPARCKADILYGSRESPRNEWLGARRFATTTTASEWLIILWFVCFGVNLISVASLPLESGVLPCTKGIPRAVIE